MTTRIKGEGASGYSLIEILVVLAIISILAIAGASMIGNRQAGAVRALMDEVEGALANAHKSAGATGRDVAVVTWGTWDVATPLRLAHGDASTPAFTVGDIKDRAEDLLKPNPPALVPGTKFQAFQSVAVPFRFMPNDAIHSRARIVAVESAQWINVMLATPAGTKNDDLTKVAPFDTGPMNGVVDDANNLFSLSTAIRQVVISGSNKRFNTTFIIPVVGVTSSGSSLPGGPMGMIVVLGNGGSIYKFYNPGARDSDGKWRRL